MSKLLIVEDDLYIRDIYAHVLKQAGYEVDEAEDGEEGLLMLDANDYEMILLDIMLPKISGIDVLTKIRTEGFRAEKTPVFFITNLGQENILTEAMKLGGNGYIIKSQVNINDIVKTVNEFLKKG